MKPTKPNQVWYDSKELLDPEQVADCVASFELNPKGLWASNEPIYTLRRFKSNHLRESNFQEQKINIFQYDNEQTFSRSYKSQLSRKILKLQDDLAALNFRWYQLEAELDKLQARIKSGSLDESTARSSLRSTAGLTSTTTTTSSTAFWLLWPILFYSAMNRICP